MRSTKIFVIQLKEILYTAFFAVLGIVLIILLIFMFTSKKDDTSPTMKYTPGVYSSSILLDGQPINVEVAVDSDHVNSVKLQNLNESTEILYPLLEPAMSQIESQLINDISLDTLDIRTDYKYTSSVLVEAIEKALEKAQVKEVHN